MSFVGGGTDFESFFSDNPGGVISTSIDKYVYVTIKEKFDQGIKLSYSNNENITKISQIKHKLIKKIFQKYSIKSGIELSSLADIHSKGTGLGSSSAFSLCTISSIRKYLGLKDLNKYNLAIEAYNIEKSINNSAMGVQDQFASSFGGLNYISFYKKKILVKKIKLNRDELSYIENNLFLVYTDTKRSASNILKRHNKIIGLNNNKIKFLRKMHDEVHNTYSNLKRGNIEYISDSIKNSWELKKNFNDDVTNKDIDRLINYGLRNGASASKLLGAGLGGFVLFYVNKRKRKEFLDAFSKKKVLSLKIDHDGTKLFKI